MQLPYIIYGLYRDDGVIFYIGVTYNLPRRLREHRRTFGRSIYASVLERRHGDRAEAEHRWIEKYRAIGHDLQNKTEGGDGSEGLSAAAREKLRALNLGKKMSAEAIEKSASKRRGAKRSLAARQRMSEAQKKRGPHSAETRAKQSAAHKGRVPPPEVGRKISIAKKGKPRSAEHSRKLSIALRGNKNRIKNQILQSPEQLTLF